MRTPMPSPKGTNREGLFLTPKAAAYDAAMTDDKRGKVRAFLGTKLDQADLDALEKLLDEDDENAGGDPDVAQDAALYRQRIDRLHRSGAISEKQAFDMKMRGPPPPPLTPAQRAEYQREFPHANRLK